MKHFPRFITCLMVLAVLTGCVLPGNPGKQNELPPTITAVSVPPGGDPATDAAPDDGQPPTITPQTPVEDNAITDMVRVWLTAPAAAAGQPFTITLHVNNRPASRSPGRGLSSRCQMV